MTLDPTADSTPAHDPVAEPSPAAPADQVVSPPVGVESLFRAEVFAARLHRLEGEVSILQPLSVRVLTLALLATLLALGVFLACCRIAHVEHASGTLVPANGTFRVTASQAGTLVGLTLQVGDRVEQGQTIAQIVSTRFDDGGHAADADIVQELQRTLADLDASERALQQHAAIELRSLEQARLSALQSRNQLEQQHALLTQRQRLSEDKLARARASADAGLMSKMQLLDVEDQTLTLKTQVLAALRERSQADATLATAQTQIAQAPLDLRQQLSALAQRRSEASQRLDEARLHAQTSLKAPHAGRVAAVLVHAGETLEPNRAVLVLVDEDSPLQAELLLPSRAIGFIRPGQVVQVRLDAFPYQRFGYQSAEVREVARIALAAADYAGAARDEPVYRVTATLAQQSIMVDGQTQPLSAGMALSADIVIDRPRVIEWLFESDSPTHGH